MKYLILIAATVALAALPYSVQAGNDGPKLPPPERKTGSTPADPTVVPSRKRQPSQTASTDTISQRMSPDEMNELVRALVLELIPSQYDDARKWNKTKEVISGLSVRLDGLRLKTNRRRKMVNHGTWKRYTVELLNPKQEFDFKIDNLKAIGPGKVEFRASVVTPLRVIARLQEWSYGARLLSISTEAESRVQLRADWQVHFDMDGKTFPPDVIIKPQIKSADLELIDFEVKRISHVKGSLAAEMGRSMRSLVERQIKKKRQQLPQKINRKIERKQDNLRLSLSDLLESKWGKVLDPLGDGAKTTTPSPDSSAKKNEC